MEKLKPHGYSSIFELFIGATNGYDNFGKTFDWSGNNSNVWGKCANVQEGNNHN